MLRSQPNTWIYAILTILVVLLAVLLNLPSLELAILVLAIGMVWIAEFINTAIERIVDLASPQKNALAKAGKDVGACAVLLAAICSVFVGLFILGPRLIEVVRLFLIK